MRRLYTLFYYKGAPVKAHWSLLFMLPVFYFLSGNVIEPRSVSGALIGFVSYAALILIHELGHAFVAGKRGLEVIGIYLYPMHGRCDYQAPEYEVDEIWVAWGGVIAQAILLLTGILIAKLLHLSLVSVRLTLDPMFMAFISMNGLMIIINLMPMSSLDGEMAWRAVPKLWSAFVSRSLRDFTHWLKSVKKSKRVSEKDASRIADEVLKKIMNKEETQ